MSRKRKLIKTNISIDRKLHGEFKDICMIEERPMVKTLRGLIKGYVSSNRNKLEDFKRNVPSSIVGVDEHSEEIDEKNYKSKRGESVVCQGECGRKLEVNEENFYHRYKSLDLDSFQTKFCKDCVKKINNSREKRKRSEKGASKTSSVVVRESVLNREKNKVSEKEILLVPVKQKERNKELECDEGELQEVYDSYQKNKRGFLGRVMNWFG
ncbi:MAG: hypothetical protein Q8P81_03735 [Nanoarchaeota archaeon]|nr:hypothetical protein [Nanoarchaeota archaeon]